MACELSEWCC